jgi:hypothetical protein
LGSVFGDLSLFLGTFLGVKFVFLGTFCQEVVMKKKNFKGRCEKKSLSKCEDVCKTYNAIQSAYANILQDDDRIKEFVCNVPLVGLELGEYTTDFLCTKINGAVMVRECVYRKFLTKPMTVRLLETSKDYWTKSGVKD